jgi:hypothetical protein
MTREYQVGFLSAVVTYKDGRKKVCARMKHNILVNSGKDWVHAQIYTNTSAGTRGAGCIAHTQSTITPAVGDTTLSGEITDAAGLTRYDATTKNHTAASNSTLIEDTKTISGAGYTDVKASALFNQATIGGTMLHEANFSTSTGALASGDTLKTSWTVNAS